jgi:TonB-dependent starch-binding outer membrane protein SusC
MHAYIRMKAVRYLRLDNFSVAYSVPRNLLQKIKVENLKIYGTINNVAYWAPNWKFWDPEESGPNPRNFTIGINLTL